MQNKNQRGEIVTLITIVTLTIVAASTLISTLFINSKNKFTYKPRAEGGFKCPGGDCDKCAQTDREWLRRDGCPQPTELPTQPQSETISQPPVPTITTISPALITKTPTLSVQPSEAHIPTTACTQCAANGHCEYHPFPGCTNDGCTVEGQECPADKITTITSAPVETPTTMQGEPTICNIDPNDPECINYRNQQTNPTILPLISPSPMVGNSCFDKNTGVPIPCSTSQISSYCDRNPDSENCKGQPTPTIYLETNNLLKVSDLPPCTQCGDDQKCSYHPEFDKRGGANRFGCTDTGCTSDTQCKGYKTLVQKGSQQYVVPSDYNLELKSGVYYVEGIGLLDCVDATICTVGLKQTSYTSYDAQMPYGSQTYDMTNVDTAHSVPFTVAPQLNPMINPKLIDGIPVQGDKPDEPTHEYSDYRPVPIGKAIDYKAPNFTTLIEGDKNPRITSLYSICAETDTGCQALKSPTSPKNISMIGLSVPDNKTVRLPAAGRNIDPNNNAMVLYVCPEGDCVVLKYAPNDNVWGGYTLTLKDGIKVDPNLYREYQQADQSGRTQLPGIKNLQALGVTNGKELKITIRDQSEWMDPRSENDWWGKRPPGLKDETVLY